MYKRIPLLSALPVIAICIGLSSCAKKETPDTPSSRLVGTWKKVQFATDDNNNGTIDKWEIFGVQPNITNTIEFNKDNTGVEKTTFSPDLGFRWQIVGDLSVRISYDANDTVTYNIASVNSSSLNLTTRTTFSLVGYYYDKK